MLVGAVIERPPTKLRWSRPLGKGERRMTDVLRSRLALARPSGTLREPFPDRPPPPLPLVQKTRCG